MYTAAKVTTKSAIYATSFNTELNSELKPAQTSPPKEFFGINLIKSIATAFVFLFYFFYCAGFLEVKTASFNLLIQAALRQTFQTCVPLFLTSTGFLQAYNGFPANTT